MNSFDDELSSRLAGLASDLNGMRPPGPAAARRRAAQRTRHQVIGGVLGGVAVIAVGVLGITQGEVFDTAPPQPAETPTTNVSPVPTEALMTVADLPGPAEMGWTQTDEPAAPFDCAPDASSGSTQVHYVNEPGGRFDQFVESTDDPEQRLDQLRTGIEQCVAELTQEEERLRMVEAWSVDGLGDEAWMAVYFAPLAEPDDFVDTNAVEVRLVRSDEYVSVVVHGGPSQEFNEAMNPDVSTLAATRLCDAVGGSCVGEPDPEQLYPADVGDLPGWLTVDDVVAATGLEQLARGTEPQAEENGWNLAGLPPDPAAAGARAVDRRMYYDPQNPTETTSVDEYIARFPDEAAARAHYDDLVAAADSFEQEGDVITDTGPVEGDGYEGTTWRSENTEIGIVFVYGVVTSGDAVAVVSHSIDSYENRDVTADQMRDLMDRAGQRIGG